MDLQERKLFVDRIYREFLPGGLAVLSEWTAWLASEADTAFLSGSDLATVLVAQAAIEAHLRYGHSPSRRASSFDLIDNSDLPDDLRAKLHELRRYRNNWVHVNDPHEDMELLERPEHHRDELEQKALLAIRCLAQVIALSAPDISVEEVSDHLGLDDSLDS